MSPVIRPIGASKLRLSTASSPPKRTVSRSTSSPADAAGNRRRGRMEQLGRRPGRGAATSTGAGRRRPSRSKNRCSLTRHPCWAALQRHQDGEHAEDHVQPVGGVGAGEVAGDHGGQPGEHGVPRLAERSQGQDGEQDQRRERLVVAIAGGGEVDQPAVQDPGHGREEGGDAEHDDAGHVRAQPERRHGDRGVAEAAQDAPEAPAMDQGDDDRARPPRRPARRSSSPRRCCPTTGAGCGGPRRTS